MTKTNEAILRIISVQRGVAPELMFSMTRKHRIVTTRQLFHWFMKKYTAYSLANIGAVTMSDFERTYDHATVLNSIKSINNFRDTDRQFRQELEIIDAHIFQELDTIKRNQNELKVKRLDITKDHLWLRQRVLRACRISKTPEILRNELIALL